MRPALLANEVNLGLAFVLEIRDLRLRWHVDEGVVRPESDRVALGRCGLIRDQPFVDGTATWSYGFLNRELRVGAICRVGVFDTVSQHSIFKERHLARSSYLNLQRLPSFSLVYCRPMEWMLA